MRFAPVLALFIGSSYANVYVCVGADARMRTDMEKPSVIDPNSPAWSDCPEDHGCCFPRDPGPVPPGHDNEVFYLCTENQPCGKNTDCSINEKTGYADCVCGLQGTC
ncbi:unnamed protein product [Zymoseptoria tritici ST99CH_1A5]|uniref:EGF-like domain-containing protein n=1 Tax=Zymoseptoria tritici ST99CH_1A5 TaxID=1276529 RepID=A0A1Y6LUJ6_ZYMTR|nr:unnamed protein product [Zymoseptoria tritici ST99CH_3D1]SMY27120.1 unnamed protein product [Zymoseptoria tritici ST99CH_1A5]